MRYYDQGSCFRVTVADWEVDNFNSHWPGSELSGSYSFTFEKSSGDLIDMRGKSPDAYECSVLCERAKQYGEDRCRRSKLPTS